MGSYGLSWALTDKDGFRRGHSTKFRSFAHVDTVPISDIAACLAYRLKWCDTESSQALFSELPVRSCICPEEHRVWDSLIKTTFAVCFTLNQLPQLTCWKKSMFLISYVHVHNWNELSDVTFRTIFCSRKSRFWSATQGSWTTKLLSQFQVNLTFKIDFGYEKCELKWT